MQDNINDLNEKLLSEICFLSDEIDNTKGRLKRYLSDNTCPSYAIAETISEDMNVLTQYFERIQKCYSELCDESDFRPNWM